MEAQIESFIEYCHNVKGTSRNTELSYRRDLYQLADFLRAQYQMTRVEDLTATALYGYIRFLEKKQRKAAKMCIRDRYRIIPGIKVGAFARPHRIKKGDVL